jgi:hypothetical protein
MQILVLDPPRMSAVLAANDFIAVGRVAAAIRTKPGKVEGTGRLVLDMPQGAIRSQWTESPRVMRARLRPQRGRGRDVEVGAVVALGTDAVFAVFFALAFIAQVEGVRELAGFALFAQPALVVFAD